MEYINKVEIQGRVGTVRLNEHNGRKVANFSIATELLYKSREGIPVSEITWHNIVAWSGREIVNLELIAKGTPVYVCGRLKTHKYTSTDGTDKFFYEVMANKVCIVKDETDKP